MGEETIEKFYPALEYEFLTFSKLQSTYFRKLPNLSEWMCPDLDPSNFA